MCDRVLFDGLNAAQRLGLRDAALRHGFSLWFANPLTAPNGAALIATLASGAAMTGWFTRDRAAAAIGMGWGVGEAAPLVEGGMNASVALEPIDPTLMLPKAAAAVRVIPADQAARYACSATGSRSSCGRNWSRSGFGSLARSPRCAIPIGISARR